MVGSNPEGSVFENEQIGHIHVMVLGRAPLDTDKREVFRLLVRGIGDTVELRDGGNAVVMLGELRA